MRSQTVASARPPEVRCIERPLSSGHYEIETGCGEKLCGLTSMKIERPGSVLAEFFDFAFHYVTDGFTW